MENTTTKSSTTMCTNPIKHGPEPATTKDREKTVANGIPASTTMETMTAGEREDPQMCWEYANEIYQYLREQEVNKDGFNKNLPNPSFSISLKVHHKADPNYFKRQSHINTKMRVVLIDWLIQVHYKFQLQHESMFLTVSIMDRYLSVSQLHCI